MKCQANECYLFCLAYVWAFSGYSACTIQRTRDWVEVKTRQHTSQSTVQSTQSTNPSIGFFELRIAADLSALFYFHIHCLRSSKIFEESSAPDWVRQSSPYPLPYYCFFGASSRSEKIQGTWRVCRTWKSLQNVEDNNITFRHTIFSVFKVFFLFCRQRNDWSSADVIS